MGDAANIDAKLDRLLEGQVETRTLLKVIDSRVGKLEHQHSNDRERLDKRFLAIEEYVDAEKERLDKRFETDVRPLRTRHEGMNFLYKALGVAITVITFLYTGLKLRAELAPEKPTPPAREIKPHAQVPEVRSRR